MKVMKRLVTVSLFLLTIMSVVSLVKQINQEVTPIESLAPIEITQEKLDVLKKASVFEVEN